MSTPPAEAEKRLELLLQVRDFAPQAEFAAQAEVADAAVYEQAAADPQAWWAGQARQRLDWDTPFAESAEPVLEDALRQHVAERIGKLARPKRIIWAGDVPKTRSGKIMRRLLRDIAEGRDPGDATTLRDPSVLAKLQQATTQDDSESAGAPETGNTR